ncbi:MAG TPA: hypothetical protein VMF61_05100 [Candidatus Acidoferrales bacterium]|nr:hypothetical protein [Candidatus Acidoferrales bacterium]
MRHARGRWDVGYGWIRALFLMTIAIGMMPVRTVLIAAAFLAVPAVAAAQAAPPAPSPSASPAADATARLQIATENPLSYLLKIPFQYNLNFEDGADRLTQQQLKIEPIVPTQLGNGGLWVSRFVLPVESVPPAKPTDQWTAGLGDLNPQFYYTPRAGPVMFGFGPTFSIPTGSNSSLGNGKWCAGADAAFVDAQPRSLFYVLAYNYWGFAGNTWKKTVDSGNIQPTASWVLGHGFDLGVQSNTSVNWTSQGAGKWTVPLGPTWSQMIDLDTSGSKAQIGGGFFWNVVRPIPNGSTWTARVQLTFVYPDAQQP